MRTSRLLIILSIFLCTKLFSNAAIINKNFHSEEEKEETVANETQTTLPIEALKRSLNSTTRYFTFDSRHITPNRVKSERRKRDVVTDDGTLPEFAIYDAMLEDGKLLRREGHVTKKHGKRRRHRQCKKRSGCPRSGHRNNNNKKKKHNDRKKKNDSDDIKIIIPIEPRKWFQYQSRSNNRNFQTQVLVGNRSLALFRQQLAAAAAADAVKSSTTVTDRLIDSSLRRPHVSTTNSAPQFSAKHKNKNTKDKFGKKNDKKKKNRHEKIDKEKIVAKVTPEVSSEKNVSEHQRNSSIIEDNHPSDIINYEQQTIVVKRVPRTKSMDAE